MESPYEEVLTGHTEVYQEKKNKINQAGRCASKCSLGISSSEEDGKRRKEGHEDGREVGGSRPRHSAIENGRHAFWGGTGRGLALRRSASGTHGERRGTGRLVSNA